MLAKYEVSEAREDLDRIGAVCRTIIVQAKALRAESLDKTMARLAIELDEPQDGLLEILIGKIEGALPTIIAREVIHFRRCGHRYVSLALRDVLRALLWLKEQSHRGQNSPSASLQQHL